MSMVNERQPFVLRCAVLYCFQCFLYKNQKGQAEIVATLLPSTIDGEPGGRRALGAGRWALAQIIIISYIIPSFTFNCTTMDKAVFLITISRNCYEILR